MKLISKIVLSVGNAALQLEFQNIIRGLNFKLYSFLHGSRPAGLPVFFFLLIIMFTIQCNNVTVMHGDQTIPID
jgi:hypothetical protein